MLKKAFATFQARAAERRNHRTDARRKQRGITMPEAMLGLAIIAIVTSAGIVAYNQVVPRTTANTYYAGLQGFMVDTMSYLVNYHTDQPGGLSEANAAKSSNVKAWTSVDGKVEDISVTCSVAAPCPNGNTTGTQSFANPNMQRLVNMPSLRFGDGTYDEDSVAEWHIPISANQALEVAFATIPKGSSDKCAPGLSTNESTLWDKCECVDTASASDTPLLVQIAIDDKAVCDSLAQSVARMEHVAQAFCADGETSPKVGSFDTTNTDGAVGLQICFGNMR